MARASRIFKVLISQVQHLQNRFKLAARRYPRTYNQSTGQTALNRSQDEMSFLRPKFGKHRQKKHLAAGQLCLMEIPVYTSRAFHDRLDPSNANNENRSLLNIKLTNGQKFLVILKSIYKLHRVLK